MIGKKTRNFAKNIEKSAICVYNKDILKKRRNSK